MLSSRKIRHRGPAGDALNALLVQVRRCNGLLNAADDILAASAGQTSARGQVMAVIEERPQTVADIARVLGLARQSVQRVADVLVKQALADYRDNPGHRRAKLLRLSAEGQSTLQVIQSLQEPWADAIGLQVGEETLRRATHTLRKVLQAVEAFDWEA
jgi:DNA-binding MarR family transcriptional regulator